MATPVDFDPFAQVAPLGVPVEHDPFADKYQQAAADKFAKLKSAGLDTNYGPTEQFANGALLGALPTIIAGLETPFAMASHGTLNPREGYNYAKAEQNLANSGGEAAHPYLSAGANLAGGVMTGSSLPRAGLTAVREGAGLLGKIVGSAADGAALGGASGFLSNEGGDRFSGAAQGAALGGAIGGGVPAALGVIKGAAAPVTSNLSARLWPENSAKSTLARALISSGQTPEGLQAALDNATAAGQPQFTLADALGKPGADSLSNVVRSPGEAGTQAANFLDARQAAQGRDVGNQLSQGLGVNRTAAQLSDALLARRSADADVNYGAARTQAGAVDVSPVVAHIDSHLTPGVNAVVNPMSDLSGLPIDGKLQWIRDRLATDRNQLTDFSRTFGVKRQIDSMIGTATRGGDGATVSVLRPIRDALDNQLANASQPYADARNVYRQQSQAAGAIDTGRAAARTGRPEDTIPVYNNLSPDAQSAYRTGYADPLLENATNGNPNANKALPLQNEGTRAELGAMSQYQGPLQPGAQDQLAQALNRSDAMNATFRRARTGSQTFDNLSEGHQAGVDPGILWEMARGNFHGAAADIFHKSVNALSGSTPETRNYLAQMLLMRGPTADVASALSPKMQQIEAANKIKQALMGATLGGSAVISSRQNTSVR